MKKNYFTPMAATVATLLMLSGCGSDSSSNNSVSDPLELESDGKTLIFYSASTNEQYAFNVDSESTTDLNAITNFTMNPNDAGRLFVWIDNKGDDNASNDEEKVLMFTQEYDFAHDGNATSEDFYYLGHFHSHTDDHNMTSYELAAHDNDEFNVTDGAKYNAMLRLNTYLAAQENLKTELTSLLPAQANGICMFHQFENEEGATFYYVMGTNGTMYIYDSAYTFKDSVAVSSNCESNGVGISSTEDGVLLFLSNTQKVYSVDSHEDGVYHVHNSWDLSDLLGSGKSAQMMVGIQPLIQE